MNKLNRSLFVLVLALIFLPGLTAETVVDSLYSARKYDLADAYWAAGQRFVDLGQADRGAEFKAKALLLFPGYVPGQAPAAKPLVVDPATVATPTAVVAPTTPALREKNLQGEKIAKLQFQKLLRGYLTGNAATIASVLAANLEVQGQSALSDTETVAAFLQAHPAQAGAPDDLFQVETLEVVDGPGNSILLTVRASSEAGLVDLLPFWKASQTYTFDRIGETWKLVSIRGQ